MFFSQGDAGNAIDLARSDISCARVASPGREIPAAGFLRRASGMERATQVPAPVNVSK
jgi:hypothetical protein